MKGRRRKTPKAALVLAAALTMALAACGSGNSGGSAPATSTGAEAANPTAPTKAGGNSSTPASPGQSAQQLVAAAEKEGSVTWYTANSDKDVPNIVAAFNKKYPNIKVNTLRLSSDKIPSRVLTEQKGGKYNADVIGAEASYMAQMIQAGAVVPYTPPDEAPLPTGFPKITTGFGNVDFVTTTVIVYNPSVLKQKGLPVPTSFEDLTKPAWKGNFSVNPGALSWYTPLVTAMGHDKALQLAKALGDNSPRLVESHTQAITQVQSGEPAATAMAYGYLAANLLKKSPGSLVIVNPNPVPAGYNLVEVAKNAPHPAAAKLLTDWIMSQAGQQAIIDVTAQTSIRTDVKSDPSVWDPSKWTPAWEDPSLPAATFNQYTSELKSAFHAQ